MASLHYLTVQDMLWINLQVIGGKAQSWHFMKLEEGTYYQYAYGSSADLIPQAARFVSGFTKNAPFAEGNEASALIGVLTFLAMNGMSVSLNDASGAAWFGRARNASEAEAAIREIVSPDEHGHHELQPDVHAIAESFIAALPQTIAALNASTVRA